VVSASRSFYDTFAVKPSSTEGKNLYELGSGQWDIPRLRDLLERILPGDASFDNFRVDLDFPGIGHRTMVLNARRIPGTTGNSQLILLAIEDVTLHGKAGDKGQPGGNSGGNS
jgi:hypothetical protein